MTISRDILTRNDANHRSSFISDVSVKVHVELSEQPADYSVKDFPTDTVLSFKSDKAEVFVDAHATSVQKIVLNGEELDVEKAFRDHRIYLDNCKDENELHVVARFPYSRAGVGLHRFVDPTDNQVFLYTQFEPFEAHRVYPCFDQPDLKIRFSLTADVPEGWQVISNAPSVSTPEELGEDKFAAGTWSFAETKPISPYITALIAGPFVSVKDQYNDIPLGLYCRPSLAKYLDHEEFFDITKSGLKWFEENFDQPYPFEKYDQIFCPQFNFGAMENPGAVTFTERVIFRSKVTEARRASRANTILHEMAHMWFGDMVTMTWWDDLWLNESFATFIATTALSEATRFGQMAWSEFAVIDKSWGYDQDLLPTTHPISTDASDTHIVMANFDGITYAKGASVVKQLFAYVGREPFFKGLINYFEKYAWGNASLKEFLAELAATSGKDLMTWADAWLLTTGPDLFELEEKGDDLVLKRVEGDTRRDHRLNISSYMKESNGSLVEKDTVSIEFTGEEMVLDSKLKGSDLLVINDDDLTYARTYLSDKDVETLKASLHTIENEVTRAILWGSIWQMVRDAKLPINDYLTIVDNNLPKETDSSITLWVARCVLGAVTYYIPDEFSVEARRRMCRLATVEMEKAASGSDELLSWAQMRIDMRRDVPWISGIIDGSVEIPGIEVVAELRWRALKALAAMGLIDRKGLEEELENDPNDAGKIEYEAALALLPSKEDKERVFDRGLEPDTALHYRREILANFWDVLPEVADGLVDEWLDKWVKQIPSFWEGDSGEESQQLTEAIYPSPIVSEKVVEEATRAIETMALPVAATRPLIEKRDQTQRALRVREFNKDKPVEPSSL